MGAFLGVTLAAGEGFSFVQDLESGGRIGGGFTDSHGSWVVERDLRSLVKVSLGSICLISLSQFFHLESADDLISKLSSVTPESALQAEFLMGYALVVRVVYLWEDMISF